MYQSFAGKSSVGLVIGLNSLTIPDDYRYYSLEVQLAPVIAPSFKETPSEISIDIGSAREWTLPEIEPGSLSTTVVGLRDNEFLASYVTLVSP